MSIKDRKHKIAVANRNKRLNNMNPNGNPQPQRQINIIAELEQYVSSYQLLTGEKPTLIVLVDPLYNLYIQTVQKNAEAFGLNPGFKNDEITFMGTKIEKKSPLIIPPSAPVEPKVN